MKIENYSDLIEQKDNLRGADLSRAKNMAQTDKRSELKDRMFAKCRERYLDNKDCKDCVANNSRICCDSSAFMLLPIKVLTSDVEAFEKDDREHVFRVYAQSGKVNKTHAYYEKTPVVAINRYTNEETVYESVSEAARDLNLSSGTVSRGCSKCYIFKKKRS